MYYYDTTESGKRIQVLRKKQGLTQEQLAAEVGISVEMIGKLERGVKGTTIDTMAIIAQILESTVDYLALGREIRVWEIDIPEEKQVVAWKIFKAILENI